MNVYYAIYIYKSPERQHMFVKSRMIASVLSSGKSYLLSYTVFYELQKDMRVDMTKMIAKRDNVIGRIGIHNLVKW